MKKGAVKKEPKYLTEAKFGSFENKFKGFETKFHVFENTFEKSMVSIAKSFDRIDKKLDQHDKAFEVLLKQMQTFTEEGREHRQSMSSLIHTDIKQERAIEDLQIRVERLEMQNK